MKRHLFGLIVFVSFGMLVLAAMRQGSDPGLQVAAPIKRAPPAQNAGNLQVDVEFGKMPLYFIANQGQMDGRVAYYVQGKDKTLYFTQEGLTIALNGHRKTGEDLLRIDSKSKGIEHLPVKDEKGQRRELHNGDSSAKSYIERWVVKLDFVGPNRDVKLVGLEKTEALISYFRGKPGDWKTGLSTYSKIVYPDLWPGIDLAYYGNINQLKYEFIVHPGADPSQIQLAYRGITGVSVTEDGRLEIMTPLGSFHDGVPIAYQEVGGKKVDVALAYNLEELGKESTVDDPRGPARENCPYNYGFKVGPYDRTIPLILDPMILIYCGYIGGSNDDYGLNMAIGGSGNAYVTGYTFSDQSSFPTLAGPDLTHNGSDDAFVVKVNAAGTGLVYCGYIGGSNDDIGVAIAVDSSGNAYVAGLTASNESSFPVTVGPDLTQNGSHDAFVVKVNAAGTGLTYCGYIGGLNEDWANGIAVDSSGNAYVWGDTSSDQSSFPVTVGPGLTYNGGDWDAFVAKVNAAGTELTYCGYIGGLSVDWANRIAVDSSGNAYVSGDTSSDQSSFPVTVGPDLTYNGGDWDAFVAKVNAAGTELAYCGYIGGSSSDSGGVIAVDSSGNAYVAGKTSSDQTSFPVAVGPDLTYNGGDWDAFVAKVNAAGTGLNYCGYIGGSGDDYGYGVAVDSLGNAYVAGKTSSDQTSFPVAVGPDLTYNGGDWDAFVAKVNAAGTGLNYCGYIGGSGDDYGYGVAVDSLGNAYVVGTTYSDQGSFPVTVGPDLTFNGIVDGFVAKIAAFSKDDLLGTWSTQGVYFRNSDTGAWTKLGSAANMITAGDLDGDGVDDLIGIWPTQGGVWIKYSKTSAWSKLSSTADWIAVGDINGDGRCDLLGTWAGQGVYYRNSISGVWVKMSTPATRITAGDLDGDGVDDLIGIWPAQGGVWVKYSKTGGWSNLSSTADWIGAGDMNGDGRADFLGTWAGQGVYYRNSVGGAWMKMSSPATQIVAGQIDDDLCDDLLGMWPSQGGVWVKYSKTSGWSKLSSTADWISAGKMRLLGMLGGIFEPAAPVGGFALGPSYQGTFEDLSEQGPLGVEFRPVEQRNTVVGLVIDNVKQRERRPAPANLDSYALCRRISSPRKKVRETRIEQNGHRQTGESSGGNESTSLESISGFQLRFCPFGGGILYCQVPWEKGPLIYWNLFSFDLSELEMGDMGLKLETEPNS